MLVPMTPEAAAAAVAAMRDVAAPVTPEDRITIQAAWHWLFGQETPLNVDFLPPFDPTQLTTESERSQVAHAVAVMPFVDGALDETKATRAADIAGQLGIHEDMVTTLRGVAFHRLRAVLACMIRENMISLHNGPVPKEDDMAYFFPYRDAPDPDLLKRHQALESLPVGTLGREYHAFYQRNQFPFPGDPKGLTIEFAHPHDTTHLLSGYNTDPHGELLVSTFTAGMHPENAMEAHILPVIFSWHLEIKLNDLAKSSVCEFDPTAFWRAWARGQQVNTDVFAPGWSFWDACEQPLDDLRAAYGVPPP